MEDLGKFKNKIFLHGVLVMLAIEVISLPFLGFNLKFLYGLLLGTAISIVNFNIMAFTFSRILSNGNRFMATVGYLIRLIIYGGVFMAALNVSRFAAFGCLAGFVTLKIAIYYLHGFKPGFKWVKLKKGGENKHKKKNILIRDPYKIKYCKGKAIITHKRFIDYKR